jgi:hypothetical protein
LINFQLNWLQILQQFHKTFLFTSLNNKLECLQLAYTIAQVSSLLLMLCKINSSGKMKPFTSYVVVSTSSKHSSLFNKSVGCTKSFITLGPNCNRSFFRESTYLTLLTLWAYIIKFFYNHNKLCSSARE